MTLDEYRANMFSGSPGLQLIIQYPFSSATLKSQCINI